MVAWRAQRGLSWELSLPAILGKNRADVLVTALRMRSAGS